MKALILTGSGTSRHAAFLPLLNRPLIRHQLRILSALEINDVVLYPPCAALGDYFSGHACDGVRLSFPEECRGVLDTSEPLLVLPGNVLPDARSLRDLIARHHRGDSHITIGSCAGPQGQAGAWIVAPGVGRDRGHILNALADGNDGNLPAVDFPLHNGTLRVATADDYLAATRMLLSRLNSISNGLLSVADGVWSDGPAFIDPDATLAGPVLLGRNCSIAAGATVTGPTVLGDASMVCRNAVVENSIIWPGAAVGSNARIIDSVIAECFTIGPGAVFEHAIAIDRDRSLPLACGSYAVQHSPRGTEAWTR